MAIEPVLMNDDEAEIFDAYCHESGYKKSTLINRLIREHHDKTGYTMQKQLFGEQNLKDKT